MSSTTNKVQWTSQLLEQFAMEWLKNDILLPDPYTDGMSQYKVKKRRSAAWRAMFAALGLPQHRPLQRDFLKKYRRMLSQTAARVRVRCAEDLLRFAPPWARKFDAHFRIAEKVVMEHVTPNKHELLLNVLRAMWVAMRGAGGAVNEGGDVWAGAVKAAATQCGFHSKLVDSIWHKARTLALTKLRLLQRVGDRTVRKRSANELTPSDWIAVDLVLLYDDTEQLLTEETLKDSEQTSTLTALFSLVQHCELDDWALAPAPSPLVHERWERAAHAYNYSGRECSMMVLQRRWWELVHMTRALLAARRTKDTAVRPICTQLAKRFPSLLTGRVAPWGELVRSGCVYAQDHTAPPPKIPLPPPTFSLDDYVEDSNIDDDIVLIENDIETIDLADLDSADETDKLIINERLKMENEQQKVLEKRRRDICDNLDNELDSTLKDIIKQNNGNERGNSSVDWSSFNNKSLDEENLSKNSANVEIDLIEKSLDGLTSSVNVGADSLQTEIDLVNDGSEQGNLKHETANLTRETTNKSPVMACTHYEKGNLNLEMIESVLKELNATTGPQKTTISLFDQLDPSTMETKIIFSDDDDDVDCNVNEAQGHVNVSIQRSVKDIDTNSKQDRIYDGNKFIKKKEHDFTFDEPARDVSINKQQEDSIINLDTDDSNSDTDISKTVIMPIIQDKDVDNSDSAISFTSKPTSPVKNSKSNSPNKEHIETNKEIVIKKYIGPKSFMEMCNKSKSNSPNTEHIEIKKEKIVKKYIGRKSFMEMSNKSKPESPNKEHDKTDQERVETKQKIIEKKRIGPKFFMEMCNKSLPNSPNTERVGSKQLISGEKQIGPKSFMESLKHRKSLESDKNDTSVIGSVKTTQINESETELESPIVSDKPSIISDQCSKNVMEISCDNEVSSDDEDSVLVIAEDVDGHVQKEHSENVNISSKLSFDEEVYNNSKNYDIESKKDIRKNNHNKSELDKTIDTSNSKIKSELDRSVDKTKTTETFQGSKCKLSFEPDDTQISNSNNDTEPAAMEVADPVVNTSVHDGENFKDSNDVSDHSYARSMSPADDTEINANEANNALSTCNSEEDDDANSHLDQLVMTARIPLYRIDELSVWKRRARDGTIDVILMEVDGSAGSSKRLKPGLRPSGGAGEIRLRADRQTTGGQQGRDYNPVVRLTRLPIKDVHGYLVKQKRRYTDADVDTDSDAEHWGRARKRVKLADIDEVRRVNRQLRTAQVKPTAQAGEAGEGGEGGEDHSARADDQTLAADTDNTLTPEELDEVLKKLKPVAVPPRAASGPAHKYCCLARRHLSYNRARARLAARAGKQCVDKELHAVNDEHTELRCSCCCLAALEAEAQCSARLAAEQRALDAALRQLAPKHKSGSSAAAASTPPPPAASEESDDDLPLIQQKQTIDKVSVLNKRIAKKKARLRERKKRKREKKEEEEAEKERETNEYDEYMRQRNMFAKYFTINPSSSTHSSRPKNSITVRPRLPDSTSKKDTKEKTLTKQMIDLHEHSLDLDIKPTRNEEVVQYNKTSNLETPKSNVNALPDLQASEMSIDLLQISEQNQSGAVVERDNNNITLDHDYVKEPLLVAIEPDKDVQNTPAPVINLSPPVRIVPGMFIMKPVTPELADRTASEGTEKSHNQQKNYKDCHKSSNIPSLAITNSMTMARWPMAKNIIIMPFENQEQSAREPQIKYNKDNYISFPQPIKLPTIQQSNPLKSSETTSQPNQQINKPKTITANQPQQPTGLTQPVPFKSPETNNQPKQHIQQPETATVNQGQTLTSEQQPITLEPTGTTNQTNPLIYHPTKIATNRSQLETQTAKEFIYMTELTNDPKKQKVTKVAGMCSDRAVKVWNYSENKALLKTLIESSLATPGSKLMRKLCSPNLNETVMAICQSSPENRNQCSLQMITQPTDTLDVNPNLNIQSSIRTAQDKILLQNTADTAGSFETNLPNIQLNVNVFPTQAIFLRSENNVPCKINTKQDTELVQNVVDNSTNKFMNKKSKDEGCNIRSEKSPVIANVVSLKEKNMASSSGGTQVDTKASGLGIMSKLNPNQSPVSSTPESDPDAKPFACILTKNKDDLTDSTSIYVDDLVKYLNENKLPQEDVKILGKVERQNILYLLGRYIIINEIQENTMRHSNLTLSFWTLKPRLHLSQILFSKSCKRKFDGERTSEPGDDKEGKEDCSVMKPKLRVKDFAKMPPEEAAAEAEESRQETAGGVTMMTGSARPDPAADVFALDGRWFKRLSRRPLFYAQVLTVVPSARAARALLTTDAQLHLLDLRGTSAPWPLRKRSNTENGKLKIDLYCAHAEEAMQELQRVLRESFSSNGEATIICHYTAGSDIVPPHTVPSNNVNLYTVCPNNVPLNTLGSNNVNSYTVGPNNVHPRTMVSDNVPLYNIGPNNVPHTVGSKNAPSYAVCPNNAPLHAVVSNNFPSHFVGSNNVPQNIVGFSSIFPHTMVSNSVPINTLVSNNLLPNVVGLNNDPNNTSSPNSVPEDTVNSDHVLLSFVNAGCFSPQAGVSPSVLQTAGNSGSVLNHSIGGGGQDCVILLESEIN